MEPKRARAQIEGQNFRAHSSTLCSSLGLHRGLFKIPPLTVGQVEEIERCQIKLGLCYLGEKLKEREQEEARAL